LDVAVSTAILRRVSRGEMTETLRIFRPGRTVAFGRRDVTGPGYETAVAVARRRGFEATERLAGGRAAVFHGGTIALTWTIPSVEPRRGIDRRFELISGLVADALRRLGVDARVGEVPGEYCPGAHSVSARGRLKLFGVGQRIVSGAVHLGGVLVVSGAAQVRDVLVPVYEALELSWRPQTTGDVATEQPGARWDDVLEAVLTEFGRRFELTEVTPDTETLRLAESLEAAHVSPGL
jgi:lipoate-protein ligase A